ncbi:ATP-binding cassette domain-containing protein [Frisingicoccus caecimuris]|jgi:Fe-S cluster assembly ATP-binding protein|uniref:Fe-S cluster assembly ATP-binding protein n=1 Tax=Frisingicoccus caecimuris TaxID=1796636 RepID=A0A4R2LDQ0_9FIRM|nr:ATP-binding cassette domain-containing protein [Frisingicoccus caecimuris]MCR1919081.1 ATP-binding cassette domain-containing protein [Frisingicoccus caecimuris]TCO84859.1 Fe-S cluster assembly ATP-binding protein [Frisingicoccus caecimuris]
MLQVKNLSYEVVENGQKLKIIDDISFDVADGELLVITGPNGGGKSTMASLLMGIKPQTAGQIILDGEDITGYDIDHRAKAGLGFAFQQPPRFKGMTVKHLIQLSSGGELSEDASCQLLSNVGLCAREYLDRQVDSSLSGGEMKRIEIATAFSKPHKLCIFDEPEAGIDLWSFSMLVQQFEEIHKKKKESIIIISHQERIIQMADRIMVIRDGRVQQIGTKEEVMPLLLEGDGDAGCKYMKH